MTAPRSEDRSSHGVTIGLREIYDKVVDLASMITHLTGVVSAIESRQSHSSTEANELEERVRMLEQRAVVTPAAMWSAIGVLATVAGVFVAILTR